MKALVTADAGLEVIGEARDGHTALRLATELKPDIAIIDISMPGLDGYCVAQRTRAYFGDATPRLVALTGFGREEDRRRSSDAGFHYHVTKPVKMAQLMGALDA